MSTFKVGDKWKACIVVAEYPVISKMFKSKEEAQAWIKETEPKYFRNPENYRPPELIEPIVIHALSDLHGERPLLPGGELLIIAGDITGRDTQSEWKEFFTWLYEQPYEKKIIVGGNHDNFLERCLRKDFCSVLGLPYGEYFTYLKGDYTTYKGLCIYGTPFSLSFHGINPSCRAFTFKYEDELYKHIKMKKYIDIVISHSPAKGYLDENARGIHCGSSALLKRLNHSQPRLMICGHIHEQAGKKEIIPGTKRDTEVYNVSCLDENYNMKKPYTAITINRFLPKIRSKTLNNQVTIYMRNELVHQLKIEAEKMKISRSDLMNSLLEEYFDLKEKNV